MVKLKNILSENDKEKIDNQELADHFRMWLIKEEQGLSQYPNLKTPEQAKEAGNWDDLNEIWALQGVRNRYAMDAEGWKDAKSQGVKAGSNQDELNEVLNFKVTEDWGWGSIITILGALAIGVVLWKRIKAAGKFLGKGASSIKNWASKKMNNETLSRIPEEQDLLEWLKAEQRKSLANDRTKMPKYMYDDLQRNLANPKVQATILKEVVNTSLNKIRNGTMNADLFVRKLPAGLRNKYGTAIKAAGAQYKKQKAAQQAYKQSASKTRPKPRGRN